MFALSTSWKASQYSRAKDIIKEIKAIGFDYIELNFGLTPAMVDEMIALKGKGVIKVVSVHNFCPIPEGILRKDASPDIFSLSAEKEQVREKAVHYTKKTIETASRIGAQVVVLHLGKVQMEERIRALAAADKNNDRRRYKRLKAQMLKERKAKAKAAFARALKSLEELTTFAGKQKIKLGIENRYYFSEIPNFEEMEIILARFPGPPLFYWHDVGHAQVYENLRFLQHKAILDKFSSRMIGMHLHDIEGIDDHRAPLKGKFDFALLKSYVKKKTLKVLEPHYPTTAEEIIRGRQYLEKLFEGV